MNQETFEDVAHENPIIQKVQKRLYKQNKNYLAAITGPTGSGKSWSALSIAEKIDPEFSADQVVFSPSGFLKGIAERRWGQGDCVVFDEAGVGMSSKEFMSKSNRMLDQTLQTFRRQNIAVIFTVPSISAVDKSARRLLHAYLETKTIDYIDERTHLKWMKMDYNPGMDKVYRKYYRRKKENGAVGKIKTVEVDKPSEDLIEAYEKKRSEFQDEVNNQFYEELKDEFGDEDDSDSSGKSKKQQIKEELKEDPDTSTNELAKKYDTDAAYVSQVKSQVST